MLPNDSQLFALLQGFQSKDPTLHDLLRNIVTRIQVLNAEVFEAATSTPVQEDAEEETETIPDIDTFTYELIRQGIRFSWNRPSSSIVFFEIRKGDTWATASRQLVTSTLSAVLDGQVIGTHRYLIKGIGLDGTESDNALAVDVVIPEIGSISLSGSVIDNFVLLQWSAPVSVFDILYYIITKDSVEIGRQQGTFATLFENTSGTYEYCVQAVDAFGNLSALTCLTLIVNQPPDYILEALETSDLTGTRTNVLLDSTLPSLIANVDLAESHDDHFVNNGWASWQAKIDAGYPYWLQPTLAAGEYEEVIDYGAVYENIIVTVDWNANIIVAGMTISVFLSTSDDNVTYTAETNSTTLYAVSMRYLKVRIEFNA